VALEIGRSGGSSVGPRGDRPPFRLPGDPERMRGAEGQQSRNIEILGPTGQEPRIAVVEQRGKAETAGEHGRAGDLPAGQGAGRGDHGPQFPEAQYVHLTDAGAFPREPGEGQQIMRALREQRGVVTVRVGGGFPGVAPHAGLARRFPPVDELALEEEIGRCAHEMILDCRPFKRDGGIEVVDLAKRLMDYGYHAPTVSFPVAGTLMIEPTESESKMELDRFCDALLAIRNEVQEVIDGKVDAENNVLKNAPHTLSMVTANDWTWPYTRHQAAYPLAYVAENKFWPMVRRVDEAYGDRNLQCTCAPVSSYAE